MFEDYSNKLHLVNTVLPLFYYGYLVATVSPIDNINFIYLLIFVGILFTAFQIHLIDEVNNKIKRISTTRFTNEEKSRYFRIIGYLDNQDSNIGILDTYFLMGRGGRTFAFLTWIYGLGTLYTMIMGLKDVVIWSSIIVYLIAIFYLIIIIITKWNYLLSLGAILLRSNK